MKLRSNILGKQMALLDASMIALERKLLSMWSEVVEDPLMTVITSSSMEVNKALDQFRARRKDQEFDYPITILHPATWATRKEGYSPFALQREGVVLGRNKQDRTATHLKLTPIDIGFGLRFVSRDVQESHVFAIRWLQQNDVRKMNILLNKGAITLPIQIKFDPNISTAEQDFGGDEKGDLVKIDSQIILSTYVGTEETVNLINKILIGYRDPHDPDVVLEEQLITTQPQET